jgi:hypothetical protein
MGLDLVQVDYPISKVHGTQSLSYYRFFQIFNYLHKHNEIPGE